MKPLFGVDITKNKKNENLNAEVYLCQKISQTSQDSLGKVSDEAVEITEKMKAPVIIRVLHFVLGIVVVMLLRILVDIEDEMSFNETMAKTPWLIPVFIACVLAFVAIAFYMKKKQDNVTESDEYAIVENRIDAVSNNLYTELGVPQNAKEVDILSFKYKDKNGKVIAKGQGFLTPIDFVNFPYKVYIEDGKLYIADLEKKYCVPFSRMVSISKVKKSIALPVWNKDIEYNKGEYKQYKIHYNEGFFHVKPYYILNVECNGEILGIYFPSYELPFFENLTGLEVNSKSKEAMI